MHIYFIWLKLKQVWTKSKKICQRQELYTNIGIYYHDLDVWPKNFFLGQFIFTNKALQVTENIWIDKIFCYHDIRLYLNSKMLSLVIHTEYKGSDIAKKRHNSCAGFVFFLHEQEYENINLMRICFYLLLTFFFN